MEKRERGMLRFAVTELLENAVATRDDELACSAMHTPVRQIMKILHATTEWKKERNWDRDARVRRIRTIAWKKAEEEGREVDDLEYLCTALVYRRAAALNQSPAARKWADRVTLQEIVNALEDYPDFKPAHMSEMDPRAVDMMGTS